VIRPGRASFALSAEPSGSDQSAARASGRRRQTAEVTVDDPAAEAAVDELAVRVAVAEVGRPELAFDQEADEDQVGVGSGLEPPLVGEPEPTGGSVGDEPGRAVPR
jgi:hypothetical protein